MGKDLYKRDSRGHFLPGNKAGPGRKPRDHYDLYLDQLEKVCTLDEWTKIVIRAIADAQRGDASARNWLSKYLLRDNEEHKMTMSVVPGEVAVILPHNGRDEPPQQIEHTNGSTS